MGEGQQVPRCPLCTAPIQDAGQYCVVVDMTTDEVTGHFCAQVLNALISAWNEAVQCAANVDEVLADAAANS